MTPLVLGCIQLTTQVFNDLPSKIQTFINNGVFQSVLNSLVHGGVPAYPEMLFVLTSFMHMLTLNSEALQLLIGSQLVRRLCEICLDPRKYFRQVAARRPDDFSAEQIESLLTNITNSRPELCEQMFSAFLDISFALVPRSKDLLLQYIEMDKRHRVVDQKINSGEFVLPDAELAALVEERNVIKEPYEGSQQRFENFF